MLPPNWVTTAGSLGTYPSGIYLDITLSAIPVTPSTTVTYKLIAGKLPMGLTINVQGKIQGYPNLVDIESTTAFTIRATDNNFNIADRTFSMTISGSAAPKILTPEGELLAILDSTWLELPIQYSNPDSANPVYIEVKQGSLPPGLEINEKGMIRGYATPPTISITSSEASTAATEITTNNAIKCISTTNFSLGKPVTFSGSVFGGIQTGITYYIKSIENSTSFTISQTQNGPTVNLIPSTGFMSVYVAQTTVGQPVLRTYNFTLKLISPLGSDIKSYSITVINQNAPVSIGGLGTLPDTRIPVILNTQPLTFNIAKNDPDNYGYYIVPNPLSSEFTIDPSVNAFIGTTDNNNYFSFKVLGYDFDGNSLNYLYDNLPLGLLGDTNTGWITGYPALASMGLNQFSFQVAAYKSNSPSYISQYFNFSFNVSNNVTGNIIWNTESDLGTINNNSLSILSIEAISDTTLKYKITDGILPPNLTLLDNGEISGYVAFEPMDTITELSDTNIFTFTVQAYSPEFPVVKSEKTFTLKVFQRYTNPTDTLYITATPSIGDRVILGTLLDNETIIPNQYLYRPDDINFGKASSVVYEHAYGIYSSNIDEYIAAVTKNHYWRNITLGEIKTAVARNSLGDIVYEVVYSEVIDNLVNPKGVSIPEEIYWPRPIDLGIGPYYTSVTNIFDSWVNVLNQDYYTSLTPGYARILYPNSLYDMRNRVAQELGQVTDSSLLPLWMTSQQPDGNIIGYIQAWVICYTKPGYSSLIQNNIQTKWLDPVGRNYRLNVIDFQIDRFTVNKSNTYNYDKSFNPPVWTGLPSADPVPNPIDSKDFYVLFPRKTILPNKTQY